VNDLHKPSVEQAGFAVLKAPTSVDPGGTRSSPSRRGKAAEGLGVSGQDRAAILGGIKRYLAQEPAARAQQGGRLR